MNRSAGTAPRWAAVTATAIGLLLAYFLKSGCLGAVWDGHQYSRLCYNDIQPLFHVRGISRGLLPYVDVQLEYPVLTGGFMYVVGWLHRAMGGSPASDVGYFNLTALLLSPFAFLVTLRLRPLVPERRLMLWAVGPPLVIYAFHNWDLLAVAGAVWGLAELERHRALSSGVGLGLGASAKLYPLFLMPGAMLDLWDRGDRRRLIRLIAGFGAAAAVANIPWMVADWEGWLGIWKFHAGRYPDFGTVWFWIAHHGGDFVPTPWWNAGYEGFVSVLSLVLFAAASIFVLYKGWRRRGQDGYPSVAAGLGILAAFLLVSKVHSPQYALWILPLIVLLEVRGWAVALYMVADVLLFVSGFYWFTICLPAGGCGLASDASGWKTTFEIAVWARAAGLASIFWLSLKSRRAKPAPAEATDEDKVSSRPPDVSSRPQAGLS